MFLSNLPVFCKIYFLLIYLPLIYLKVLQELLACSNSGAVAVSSFICLSDSCRMAALFCATILLHNAPVELTSVLVPFHLRFILVD